MTDIVPDGAQDDRPPRYVEDGPAGPRVVYRASSLGGCDRMLVACASPDQYPPAPHPAWFQTVLDEGSAAEATIDRLWSEATGIPTTGQQMPVELDVGEFDNGPVIVRAHCDGQAGVDPRGREFKKFRDSTWPEFVKRAVEVHQNYPWQVGVMMWATGWDWELVGGRLTDDGIVEVKGFAYTEPPIPFKAIFDKVRRIEQQIARGFDPKEVACSLTMFPCPQWKIHDVPDVAYEIPTTGEVAELARAYVGQLAALGPQIKELERQKKAAAEGLRGCLEVFGAEAMAARKLVTETHVISHVTKVIPEHQVKESTQDYFMVKAATTVAEKGPAELDLGGAPS